jgi:hypothetical protein
MAAIAERHSDFCVVTSDNPRSEPIQRIFDDILPGFSHSSYVVIEDRRAAIREALRMACPGDVVVIAGKGHEDYQLVGDRRLDFDDRREASFLLRDMGLARTVHDTEESSGDPKREPGGGRRGAGIDPDDRRIRAGGDARATSRRRSLGE